MNIIKEIKNQIKKNKILLYIKGSPSFPKCFFSEEIVKIIVFYNVKFSYIDVLKNQKIRCELPKFSKWPTFPQLWLNGKLIGGYEIVLEMHKKGELIKLIDLIK